MMSWFPKELDPEAYIVPSESGFTTDRISILWLHHFIKHTKSTPESEWKLLLMDNHGTHVTPEFALLANKYKIRPFPLLPHLTHVMQPLDVGVFQPYKHFHDKYVQKAISNLEVSYDMQAFLRDLTSIREETFKKSTIRSAFKKSGIWPISEQKCLEQLKKFAPKKSKSKVVTPPSVDDDDNNELPPLINTILRPVQRTQELTEQIPKWNKRMEELLSSPSRRAFRDFTSNVIDTTTTTSLQATELSMYRKKRLGDLNAKNQRSRRSTKVYKQGITVEEGQRLGREKAEATHNATLRKQNKQRDDYLYKGYNKAHKEGIEARKQEKLRIKQLGDLQRGGAPIPPHLQTPIDDPEQAWLRTYGVAFAELKARKKRKKEVPITPYTPTNVVVDNIMDTGHGGAGGGAATRATTPSISRPAPTIDYTADFVSLEDLPIGDSASENEVLIRLNSSDAPEVDDSSTGSSGSESDSNNPDNE